MGYAWSIHLSLDYGPFTCRWMMADSLANGLSIRSSLDYVLKASCACQQKCSRVTEAKDPYSKSVSSYVFWHPGLGRQPHFGASFLYVCVDRFFQTLQEFNKPQPDKSNIFIKKILSIVLWRSKRGLSRKSAHSVYWPIKLAFFLTIYVFGSSFSTLAVILV